MGDAQLEEIVHLHSAMLYRFAMSLTRDPTDSLDLVQQTFYLWVAKGDQLRDPSKAKSWLCTTLYREFLRRRRREQRFQHVELSCVESELVTPEPEAVDRLDAALVMDALLELDEIYRVPLTLYYCEDRSYAEIAQILGLPVGTVMSRLARAKQHLRRCLANKAPCPP